MASELTATLLTTICIVVLINVANGAVNLNCQILEDAFPQCECLAATGEKSSVDAIVDCSSRGLTDVPTIKRVVAKPFYKLILKNNSITALTDASFQGLRIEYVDLSGNSISSVDNSTFVSMKDNLKTLEIDGDNRSLPPINALKKLLAIRYLTMRNYNVPYIEQDDHFFLSFSYLWSLTLDNWNMIHIESSGFTGLDQLKSLSLLNQKFSTMPIDGLRQHTFDNLETLRITNSEITQVLRNVFIRLSALKHLDLSSNKIEQLGDGCFDGVKGTLQTINLQNNNLHNGNKALAGLSGMAALETLDFSSNAFKTIPKMPTLGARKPFRLLLKENEIDNFLTDSFSGYGAYLEDLDLSKNIIRAINDEAFNGVTGLKSLYLQQQRGHDPAALQLPQSLIQSSSTIETLNLAWQKVDRVSLWTLVKEMTSLKSLDLSYTELETIPDNIFIKVTSLEYIQLEGNDISTITQRSFAGARSLKKIDLTSNHITTIPSCLFYDFLSPNISLVLSLNAIVCDCKIKKLLEDIDSGRVVLEYDNKKAPTCKNGDEIQLIKPENLKCDPSIEEPPCIEFYTTTAPTITTHVTNPTPPQLSLRVLSAGTHTIRVSWHLADYTDLKHFRFQATSTNKVEEFERDNIPPSGMELEATGLPSGTGITICVTAYFSYGSHHECIIQNTAPTGTTPNKNGLEDKSDVAKTGIIVGCVVAGVALIGIVIAIIILLVCRKKPKQIPDNYRAPTQPRSYAKAELPSMSDESRTFAKPKKNGKSPHPGNMQVVAISDGQTNSGPRVGRVNMMFKPEDGYEPMSHFKKPYRSSYENDHGALPPTPGPDQDSRPPSYPGPAGGYYNQGYNEDKYDEIEVEI